jgi:hypothetical protein
MTLASIFISASRWFSIGFLLSCAFALSAINREPDIPGKPKRTYHHNPAAFGTNVIFR